MKAASHEPYPETSMAPATRPVGFLRCDRVPQAVLGRADDAIK
jgi:hypothetical protein